MYYINKEKCKVVLLCANNDIFLQKKANSFWQSKKLNILWYGNPSKLHNLEFIKNVFTKLDKNKFNCNILENMKAISLIQIAELLKNTHISLGCFGNTNKCTHVVINKEYESLASNTLLISKKGNKEFLNDSAVLCETEQEVINSINYFHQNRNKLFELANKGREKYIGNCSFNKLVKNYTVLIDAML
jgi:hypothetical protein